MKRFLPIAFAATFIFAVSACGGTISAPTGESLDEDDLGPVSHHGPAGDLLASDDEVCDGPTSKKDAHKAGALREKLFQPGNYAFEVRYANGSTSKAVMNLEPFGRLAYCVRGNWGNGSVGPQPGRVTFTSVAWIATDDGLVDGRFFVNATLTDGAALGPATFSASATPNDLRGTWLPGLNEIGHPHHTLIVQKSVSRDTSATSNFLDTLAMSEINYMNSKEYGYSQSGQEIATLRMIAAPSSP